MPALSFPGSVLVMRPFLTQSGQEAQSSAGQAEVSVTLVSGEGSAAPPNTWGQKEEDVPKENQGCLSKRGALGTQYLKTTHVHPQVKYFL